MDLAKIWVSKLNGLFLSNSITKFALDQSQSIKETSQSETSTYSLTTERDSELVSVHNLSIPEV